MRKASEIQNDQHDRVVVMTMQWRLGYHGLLLIHKHFPAVMAISGSVPPAVSPIPSTTWPWRWCAAAGGTHRSAICGSFASVRPQPAPSSPSTGCATGDEGAGMKKHQTDQFEQGTDAAARRGPPHEAWCRGGPRQQNEPRLMTGDRVEYATGQPPPVTGLGQPRRCRPARWLWPTPRAGRWRRFSQCRRSGLRRQRSHRPAPAPGFRRPR